MSYLGRGQTFGFEELARNWKHQTQLPFQHSLRALGYVDVLFVPTVIVEKFVLPTLPAELLPAEREPQDPDQPPALVTDVPEIRPEMMEFIVDRRLLNGTATMIIDLERCTRCDDCVRACAATHNNNPRLHPARPGARRIHDCQCLHALPGPHLHDRLPDRGHSSRIRSRPGGDQ